MSAVVTSWDPHPRSVRREDAGRVPVIVVTGRIDADTAAELSAAVCGSGCEKVVVDLHEVDAIDPAGVQDLLLAARVLGVRLEVVSPAGDLARRRFALAAAGGRLSMWETRAHALGSLAGRRTGDASRSPESHPDMRPPAQVAPDTGRFPGHLSR